MYIHKNKLVKFSFLLVALTLTTKVFSQEKDTARFHVSGECGQCKQRIENALKIKSIYSADWEVATKMLTVVYDPAKINLEAIHEKVAAVGHDTELKKAKDAVYAALPACCLYRDISDEGISSDHAIPENAIRGVVLSEDKKGNYIPLEGASVLWAGTHHGTISDKHGVFFLTPDSTQKNLVITYAGFRPDTILISDNKELQVILAENGELKTVTVSGSARSFVNIYAPIRIQTINTKDLLKAACCNLSESFETNPSVDVTYSDAVTGAKQIQLLGLSGIYTMLTVENLPGLRGLATPLGLNSIAGPWIESIQLSKGTGSVANGFESIAGQINVELKKPASAEKFYLNGYINDMGKTDVNLNYFQKLGERWSTGLLLHDDFLQNKVDINKDGFRDLPTGNLFSAVNRWQYNDGKGWMVQFGIKGMKDKKTGGEMAFQSSDKFNTNVYGLGMDISRIEGFAKIGYVFPAKKYKSIGLQLSAFTYKQESFFGLTQYNARQKSFYSNLIYQSIIGNSNHKFRTGLSLAADTYDELYTTQTYLRNEVVPGAFFEYTYEMNEQFSLVAGLREDYNNLYGWFTTPRMNIRYAPWPKTIIRLSAGRGQRTANIFAENAGFLASARALQIQGHNPSGAYGLDPEIAWNKGISIDQKFKLFKNDAMLSLDFYRNDFTNQVVVDLEDPRMIKFYNLQGKSFSNSFQAELNFIPIQHLDMRLAYRFFDVKSTYGNELLEKPLTANQRAFANLGYSIGDWKIDYTINFVGAKRIPSTAANPVAYQFPATSPSYISMNAQISKAFGKNKNFEMYFGGENLTNYFQKTVIIAADDPFSPYFDASLVYGPLSGRLFYGGFRYKIK